MLSHQRRGEKKKCGIHPGCHKPITQRWRNTPSHCYTTLGKVHDIGSTTLISGWCIPTPLKNMKVSWEYFSQYMEKNVPNHQPDLDKWKSNSNLKRAQHSTPRRRDQLYADLVGIIIQNLLGNLMDLLSCKLKWMWKAYLCRSFFRTKPWFSLHVFACLS